MYKNTLRNARRFRGDRPHERPIWRRLLLGGKLKARKGEKAGAARSKDGAVDGIAGKLGLNKGAGAA